MTRDADLREPFHAGRAAPAGDECACRTALVGRYRDDSVEAEGKPDLLGTLEHGLHCDRPTRIGTVDTAPEEELHGILRRPHAIEYLLDRHVVPLALAESAEAPVPAFDLVPELLAIDGAAVPEALEHPRRRTSRQCAELVEGERQLVLDRIAADLQLPGVRADDGGCVAISNEEEVIRGDPARLLVPGCAELGLEHLERGSFRLDELSRSGLGRRDRRVVLGGSGDSKTRRRAAREAADPVRIELLAQIASRGPLCVCHLQEDLPYSQSRISKHLGTLRRAGLVTTRREGTWIYYSVEEDALEIARDFIDQLGRSLHTPHEADYCPPAD